jgi:hypothetical protein
VVRMLGLSKTKCHCAYRASGLTAMTFYAHHGAWRATHQESFPQRLYHGHLPGGNEAADSFLTHLPRINTARTGAPSQSFNFNGRQIN